ncbi:chemoreceptor glutamine deamidase CheD [Chitinibacter fontanus]|uniref:Probable chemoreceptor glutamine deamidase CheD n=1 Tax=Chitinibacter fontanus TaxID=1737446 RepID=A0A7D5Z372_9NEIS|nr:chemoreceptor glutamine deamidase CheD [Chitinibacter fontanus]QLI80563.1 chemoreceptor glutamine deamidase CheD [Chitinibacter fontanus]
MSAASYEEVLAPTLYFDKHFSIEAAKILPGEYYVTAREMLLVTVLGSCVAACVRDSVSGIGGMNHFMLPDSQEDMASINGLSTRYGTYAMEVLINQLLKQGAKKNRLEAKVFGGGNVLRGFTVSNVGLKNAEFVKSFLALEQIPIVAEDLLDIHPRKVYFFPATGRVLVKKLKSVHNNTIVEREKIYGSRLTHMDKGGDIELFS